MLSGAIIIIIATSKWQRQKHQKQNVTWCLEIIPGNRDSAGHQALQQQATTANSDRQQQKLIIH